MSGQLSGGIQRLAKMGRTNRVQVGVQGRSKGTPGRVCALCSGQCQLPAQEGSGTRALMAEGRHPRSMRDVQAPLGSLRILIPPV